MKDSEQSQDYKTVKEDIKHRLSANATITMWIMVGLFMGLYFVLKPIYDKNFRKSIIELQKERIAQIYNIDIKQSCDENGSLVNCEIFLLKCLKDIPLPKHESLSILCDYHNKGIICQLAAKEFFLMKDKVKAKVYQEKGCSLQGKKVSSNYSCK